MTIDTSREFSINETMATIVTGKRPSVACHAIDNFSNAFVYAINGVVAPKVTVAKNTHLIIRGLYLLP